MRPLRLPALLVGDSSLDGISATISAYESLLLRGYDVGAIAMLDDAHHGNFDAMQRLLAHGSGAAHRWGTPLDTVALPHILRASKGGGAGGVGTARAQGSVGGAGRAGSGDMVCVGRGSQRLYVQLHAGTQEKPKAVCKA